MFLTTNQTVKHYGFNDPTRGGWQDAEEMTIEEALERYPGEAIVYNTSEGGAAFGCGKIKGYISPEFFQKCFDFEASMARNRYNG